MKNVKVVFATSALAVALVFAPVAAQGRGRGDDKHKEDPHHQAIDQRQAEQQRAVQAQQQQRLSTQEMQQRILAQQQRDRAYQAMLAQRTRTLQQQAAQLQAQRRAAAYRYQQQYLANLRAQQARLSAQRNYNNDPYYSSPDSYRYLRGGRSYQTNQYGVDALKRAVNNGYSEGVQAGQADKQDGYRADYSTSFAYQDANYGYDGRYVSQVDYNYYFRQGFQRGYQDGYNRAQRYGSYSNGSGSILGSLLNSILGLQTIR